MEQAPRSHEALIFEPRVLVHGMYFVMIACMVCFFSPARFSAVVAEVE